MKKVVSLLGVIVLMFTLLAGCGSQQAGGDAAGEEMEDIKLSYFASPSLGTSVCGERGGLL